MRDDQFECLQKQITTMQEQLGQVMEMVAVGKGALMTAKILGWVTATGVACVELWRTFRSH